MLKRRLYCDAQVSLVMATMAASGVVKAQPVERSLDGSRLGPGIVRLMQDLLY